MTPTPKKESKRVEQKQHESGKREPYQTPDIVYEGTISIRAGSPIGFTDPFGESIN
jgi:hypothetical protein